MNTANIIRTLLIVDMIGMALLALFYLRQRRMSVVSYCCWGLVALTIPILGPFLVIANRPGVAAPGESVFNDVRRLVVFIGRVALTSMPRERLARLDRARLRRRNRAGQ